MWEAILKIADIYWIIGLWIGVLVVNESFVIGKPTIKDIFSWSIRVLFVSVTYPFLGFYYIKYELLD